MGRWHRDHFELHLPDGPDPRDWRWIEVWCPAHRAGSTHHPDRYNSADTDNAIDDLLGLEG